MQWQGNVQKKGRETAGFFCTTTHFHICRWPPKSTLPSAIWWIWSICYITCTYHLPTFSYFRYKKKSYERIKIREHWENRCESDEDTCYRYWDMVPRSASKSFTNVIRSVLQLLWRKWCNIAYICALNQLQDLLKLVQHSRTLYR